MSNICDYVIANNVPQIVCKKYHQYHPENETEQYIDRYTLCPEVYILR
jgi:hypothetical protein